jgi:hypothetical protein
MSTDSTNTLAPKSVLWLGTTILTSGVSVGLSAALYCGLQFGLGGLGLSLFGLAGTIAPWLLLLMMPLVFLKDSTGSKGNIPYLVIASALFNIAASVSIAASTTLAVSVFTCISGGVGLALLLITAGMFYKHYKANQTNDSSAQQPTLSPVINKRVQNPPKRGFCSVM